MVLERSLGNNLSSLERSPFDLSNLIDDYILDLCLEGKSELTQNTYKSRLTLFCDWLNEKRYPPNIPQLTKDHIKRFLGYLKESQTKL